MGGVRPIATAFIVAASVTGGGSIVGGSYVAADVAEISLVDAFESESGAMISAGTDGQYPPASQTPDLKATIVVRLSEPLPGNATITWRTVDGSAIAGQHYLAAEQTLLMKPKTGKLEYFFKVSLKKADGTPEPDRTFGVEIVSVTGPVTITDGDATVTIVDDDSAPAISLGGDTSFPEGDTRNNSVIVVTIVLDRPLAKVLKLRVGPWDGTAMGGTRTTAGADFIHANNHRLNSIEEVWVYPGQTSVTYRVDVLGDVNPEPDETLLLHIGAPSTFRPQPIVPDDSTRVITLLNDD
jgi:hypothetical protein